MSRAFGGRAGRPNSPPASRTRPTSSRPRTGRYVLRRKPPGKLLKSAHMIEREFRVLKALEGTGFPAPRALALCEDGERRRTAVLPDGHMSRAESSGICVAGTPPRREETDLRRDERGAGEAPRDRRRCDGAIRLRQARQLFLAPAAALDRAISRERDRDDRGHGPSHRLAWRPRSRRRRPCRPGARRLANRQHDFRRRSPRLLAVLDWELSTLGHPFADLAYQCMFCGCRRRPAGSAKSTGRPRAFRPRPNMLRLTAARRP